MKKETLEEAAERIYPTDCTNWSIKIPLDERKTFIECAKWNQERSYSEENLKVLIDYTRRWGSQSSDEYILKEWFNEFKKL